MDWPPLRGQALDWGLLATPSLAGLRTFKMDALCTFQRVDTVVGGGSPTRLPFHFQSLALRAEDDPSLNEASAEFLTDLFRVSQESLVHLEIGVWACANLLPLPCVSATLALLRQLTLDLPGPFNPSPLPFPFLAHFKFLHSLTLSTLPYAVTAIIPVVGALPLPAPLTRLALSFHFNTSPEQIPSILYPLVSLPQLATITSFHFERSLVRPGVLADAAAEFLAVCKGRRIVVTIQRGQLLVVGTRMLWNKDRIFPSPAPSLRPSSSLSSPAHARAPARAPDFASPNVAFSFASWAQLRGSLVRKLLQFNPDLARATSHSSEAAALAKDVKGELGTWWTNRKRGPPSASNPAAAFTRNSSSSTNATALSSPLLPTHRRSVSSDATTMSTASGGDFAFPPDRAHLHYRDAEVRDGRQYPPVTKKGKGSASLERRYSTGAGRGLQDDDEALRKALEASRKETNAVQDQASREDEELQRALEESTALSRASVAKDRQNFKRAIRESQEEPPPSLEDSEWIIQARNEKGRIFSEGGAHGWLPPGARRASSEEQDEQAMLELAIRISLEEEAARKAFEDQTRIDPIPPPLPPRRPGMATKQSSNFSSYRTAASRPVPNTERSFVAARPSPSDGRPSRPLPPPPPPSKNQSSLTLSSSFASQSSSSSHRDYATSVETSSSGAVHTLSFPPPPPLLGIYDNAPEGGSPEEQPYLGSFSPTTSYLRHSGDQPPSDDSSSLVGSSGHHASTENIDESTFDAFDGTLESQSSSPTLAAAPLHVRNPDQSTAPPPPPPHHPYTSFISNMAGRSMSLISERTEPTGSWSTSAAEGSGGSRTDPSQSLPPMARTQSPLEVPNEDPESFEPSRSSSYEVEETLNVGPSASLRARLEAERREGPLMTQTREDLSAPPPGTLSPPSSTPPISFSPDGPLVTSSEILREPTPPATPPAVEETIDVAKEGTGEGEPRTVFGDGVRFGFPAPCAAEHSCAEDGLHATSPFPTDVVFSTFEEHRSRFAVEASTWVGLLRFLMWFGDTTVSASAEDVEEEESRHCDAGLNLEFRSNDEGDGVIRLTITLLPPNSSAPQELTLDSPQPLASSAKGKGRATPTPSSPFTGVYTLPDHLVLPARLSSLAVSLYTLRHLTSIALSTQPAKDAAPSYHALRSLGTSITSLAHQDSKDLQRAKTARVEEERLLHKLRDRLRRLKPGGGGGGNGAKLLKVPPQQQMPRTQALPREERVLTRESHSVADRAGGT